MVSFRNHLVYRGFDADVSEGDFFFRCASLVDHFGNWIADEGFACKMQSSFSACTIGCSDKYFINYTQCRNKLECIICY